MTQPALHYHNQPISFFLESLANDRGKSAIAVILSDSSSDDFIGLSAIKKVKGLVIAVDALTAKSDGMLKGAINTDIVNTILPVEKIPEEIIKYLNSRECKVPPELSQVFALLRSKTGHDFSSYKFNTVNRRIFKHMQDYQIQTLSDYIEFLEQNGEQITRLFKDLLIGVTSFFRDPENFGILKHHLLNQVLVNKPENYIFRIWVPGCSTGEEAYSIAILIRECLNEMQRNMSVQIFGTDLDTEALQAARTAIYPVCKKEVSEKRIQQFFIKKDNSYKIKNDIRKMITFGEHNIIKDPPITKVDLICCRNVLIYFNNYLQKKLIPIFHYSLNPNGILFLGAADNIGGYSDLFRVIEGKIYERKEKDVSCIKAPILLQKNPTLEGKLETLDHYKNLEVMKSINNFFIKDFIPACVIINRNGNILHYFDKVHYFLEKSTIESLDILNILEMVPSSIQPKLADAIHNAPYQVQPITYPLHKDGNKKIASEVRLKIIPVKYSGALSELFCITFEELPFNSLKTEKITNPTLPHKETDAKITLLENELNQNKEILHTTIEELQSSNEELQSINEELETSKEELQSLNEELVTVNAELQDKIDQLSSLYDDMNNLFSCTEIAAIFLDNKLNIKSFTPKISEIIPLLPLDVGRSIQHFSTNLKYDNLIEDIKVVFAKLSSKSFEVRDKNNKYYQVRILPYRTTLNVIDGVIIIFEEISNVKLAEKELKKINKALTRALSFTKGVVSIVTTPMMILSADLKIIKVNEEFLKFFQISGNPIGEDLLGFDRKQWNIPILLKKLRAVLTKDSYLKNYELKKNFLNIGRKDLILNALRVPYEDSKINILLAIKEKTL